MPLRFRFRPIVSFGTLVLLAFTTSCSPPQPPPSTPVTEQASSTAIVAIIPTATTIIPTATAIVPTATAIVPTTTPQPGPQPSSTAVGEPLSQAEAFLQTQGKDLVYKGQKVILKGINFDSVGAFGANIGTGNIDDIPFIEEDYADLSASGANHVRFGISYVWYLQGQEAFFERIDQQIAWARKHNIWISFAVFTTPGDCYEGYSKSCPFWSDPNEQQELKEFWVAMAERYGDEPAVAGYDLLNEPLPSAGCGQWYRIASDMRDAIAAVAPNQLVIIAGCIDPANTLKEPGLPRGANIVYEVHDYAPLDMSHDMFSLGSVYPGTAEDWFGTCYYDKSVFAGEVHPGDPPVCEYASLRPRLGLDWAEENNVPIYIGEWGATSRLKGYVQYHKDRAELYRDWGVNHAAYTWKHQTIKTDGFYQWGIYSEPHSFDDPARLEAIRIAWEGAVKPDFSR